MVSANVIGFIIALGIGAGVLIYQVVMERRQTEMAYGTIGPGREIKRRQKKRYCLV